MTDILWFVIIFALIIIILNLYEKLSIINIQIRSARKLIDILTEEINKLENIINNKS